MVRIFWGVLMIALAVVLILSAVGVGFGLPAGISAGFTKVQPALGARGCVVLRCARLASMRAPMACGSSGVPQKVACITMLCSNSGIRR